MKKVLFITVLLLRGAFFATVSAQNIPLSIINESEASEVNGKSPTLPLIITQDDNILTLPATSVDYTLQLRDESGTVVYSSYIPAGTTQIILPTTLFGSFEIRLVASTYYYIGYISL